MIELIYASVATVPFSAPDLTSLLAKARQRNSVTDISGVLLFHKGSFLQVLEGDEAAVDSTLARIGKDPRHQGVLLLSRRQIEQRAFADWRMGFLAVTASMQSKIDGFSDFLQNGYATLLGNAPAVTRILSAFREGSYHRSIR